MLRFICFLLGKNYEPCKGCEVLNNQLAIANHEKELLRNTLLDLVKPKVFEAPSIPIEPIKPKIVPWHMKQRELESQSRAEAKIRQEYERNLNIENLERELGVTENAQEK